MADFYTPARVYGGTLFWLAGVGAEGVEALPSAESSTPPPSDVDAGIRSADLLTDRAGFLAMLERIGLWRTSSITPGLLEQMRDLGDRRIRALVVNLLPTQPEFALPAALSRGALEEMIAGLVAIQKVVGAGKVLIVLDRHEFRLARLWRRDEAKARVARQLCQAAESLSASASGDSDAVAVWEADGRWETADSRESDDCGSGRVLGGGALFGDGNRVGGSAGAGVRRVRAMARRGLSRGRSGRRSARYASGWESPRKICS